MSSPNCYYRDSLCGMYRKGILASWVVASPYSIVPTDPIVRALDLQPSISTRLFLLRHKLNALTGAKIADIICTNGKWEVQLKPTPPDTSIQFEKGDLVLIEMPSDTPIMLCVEFAI